MHSSLLISHTNLSISNQGSQSADSSVTRRRHRRRKLKVFTGDEFPEVYDPTACENYQANMEVNGKTILFIMLFKCSTHLVLLGG